MQTIILSTLPEIPEVNSTSGSVKKSTIEIRKIHKISSPYCRKLIGDIKKIPPNYREWNQKSWLIEDFLYHGEPVINYLAKICEKNAEEQNIPFLNEADLELSDILARRVQIHRQRFEKLKKLVECLPSRSIVLLFLENGNVGFSFRDRIKIDLLEQLQVLTDEDKEEGKTYQFELTDREAIVLMGFPQIAMKVPIELTTILQRGDTVIAQSKNKQKYICSQTNVNKEYSLYILDGKLAYGMNVLTSFQKLYQRDDLDQSFFQEVVDFGLESELIKAIPSNLELEVNLIEVDKENYVAQCCAANYHHLSESWFPLILKFEQELTQIGVEVEKLRSQIKAIGKLKQTRATECHQELRDNAIVILQQVLKDGLSKEDLIQMLDEHTFEYRKSWGKDKLAKAFQPNAQWAMDYLQIPASANLELEGTIL